MSRKVRFDDVIVTEIRTAYVSKDTNGHMPTIKDLADKYECSIMTIWKIVNYQRPYDKREDESTVEVV